MVKAERNEGGDGEPDADDLGDNFSSLHGEVTGNAHWRLQRQSINMCRRSRFVELTKPICANSSEKDLVPFRCELFRDCESRGLLDVGTGVENAAI